MPDESIVRLKLKAMQLHRPRQWGACCLALACDRHWAICSAPIRGLADPQVLYECHDRLLAHQEALFNHLTGRRSCRESNTSTAKRSPSGAWTAPADEVLAEMRRRILKWLWADVGHHLIDSKIHAGIVFPQHSQRRRRAEQDRRGAREPTSS
jgi:hypothetical protein